MLASGTQILELIPQRPPMVMVDNLLSCDELVTVTGLTVREDNLFFDSKGLSPSGLLENMAQTAAVRTGWLMKKQPDGENKRPPVGVIGSINHFRLHFQPLPGMELKTTIRLEYEIMQATIVNARIEADGNLAAEAELKIFLTETEV